MRKHLLVLFTAIACIPVLSQNQFFTYVVDFDTCQTQASFPVVDIAGNPVDGASAVVELKSGSETDKVLHVTIGDTPGFVLFDNPGNIKGTAITKNYSVLAADVMPMDSASAQSDFQVYTGFAKKYLSYQDTPPYSYTVGQWNSKLYNRLKTVNNSLKVKTLFGFNVVSTQYCIDNLCFMVSADAFELAEKARVQAVKDSIFRVDLARRDSIMKAESEAATQLFPEIELTIDKCMAYDFEDYPVGTAFAVYADGKTSTLLEGAAATIVQDPKDSSNKVLHIVSSVPCYVEFENPEGLKVTNLLNKYSTLSARFMLPSGSTLSDDSIFSIMWNGSNAFNKTLPAKMAIKDKWYDQKFALKLQKASFAKLFRLGFNANGSDYYIDNLSFIGTSYDPGFSDKTKTARYWADRLGKNFGTCLNQWTASSQASLAGNNFNMVVCENEMKFDATEPKRGQFNFSGGQTVINTANQYKMKVRGHTLVWHSQNPDWVNDFKGSRKDWESILKNHIMNVVGHWKGQIAEWDVVNECLEENGGRAVGAGYATRTWSVWYQGFGDDSYIDSAFVWAHQADPSAKLYINDYNIGAWDGGPSWENGKTHAMYNLAKRLKDAGIPIDGVGMQTHINLNNIDPSQIEKTVKKFREIGLNVIITEMDLPGGQVDGSGDNAKLVRPISQAELEIQAQKYAAIADIMIRYDNCPSMVVWGVTDDKSWLDCSEGTKPLLFYADNTPHPAYIEVRKTYQRWALLRTGVDDIFEDAPDDPIWVDESGKLLNIYNMTGRIIGTASNSQQLLDLPAGMYIVGGRKILVR